MSEYIKREDAIQSIQHHDLIGTDYSKEWAEWLLEDVKPADVVEVIRCKDCKWAEVHESDDGVFCEYHCAPFHKDDFCSYGEREDGESDE